MMKKQGLEYASPFIQILEITSENVLLTASDENGVIEIAVSAVVASRTGVVNGFINALVISEE